MSRQYFNPHRQFHGIFIPDWLLAFTGCSIAAKMTYAVLARFAGKSGYCYPGQDAIAEKLGVSRRSVHAHIKELEKAALIEKKRVGMGKTNRYYFIYQPALMTDFIRPENIAHHPSEEVDFIGSANIAHQDAGCANIAHHVEQVSYHQVEKISSHPIERESDCKENQTVMNKKEPAQFDPGNIEHSPPDSVDEIIEYGAMRNIPRQACEVYYEMRARDNFYRSDMHGNQILIRNWYKDLALLYRKGALNEYQQPEKKKRHGRTNETKRTTTYDYDGLARFEELDRQHGGSLFEDEYE